MRKLKNPLRCDASDQQPFFAVAEQFLRPVGEASVAHFRAVAVNFTVNLKACGLVISAARLPLRVERRDCIGVSAGKILKDRTLHQI
jgi:hypothetical protein